MGVWGGLRWQGCLRQGGRGGLGGREVIHGCGERLALSGLGCFSWNERKGGRAWWAEKLFDYRRGEIEREIYIYVYIYVYIYMYIYIHIYISLFR